MLSRLIADGWHPSTSSDPALSGAANPYGVEGRRPLVIACQPANAAALLESLSSGEQVTLESTHSIARSASDPRSGRLAIRALEQSCCAIVAVSEHEIVENTRLLARHGHYVETSSAVDLAGIATARRLGRPGTNRTAIAVLTAQGRGWNEDIPGLFDGQGPA